jgi:Amt family ammonium transporter
MMMMSLAALALISVLWSARHSMAFGNSVGGAGLLGNPSEFLACGLMSPDSALVQYQQWLFGFSGCVCHHNCCSNFWGFRRRARFERMVFAGIWATFVLSSCTLKFL